MLLSSLKNRSLRKKCLQGAIDSRQSGNVFVRRLSTVPVPVRTSRAGRTGHSLRGSYCMAENSVLGLFDNKNATIIDLCMVT